MVEDEQSYFLTSVSRTAELHTSKFSVYCPHIKLKLFSEQ